MALPKIDSPIFMLDLPSTKETIKYRPFTVKEEKILLIASQSDAEKEITSAIEQIITNCAISDVDLKKMTSYDIEYFFLQLRARSVNNIINLSITDDVDGEVYEVEINLDEVLVPIDENREFQIKLNSEITLMMKDLSYDEIKKLTTMEDEEQLTQTVVNSIDQILVGDDEVLTMKEHTKKEQQDFIDSFSSKNMRDIEEFLSKTPKLSHNVTYTREDGTEVTKVLEGMQTFFT